jgi:hypothetical protein
MKNFFTNILKKNNFALENILFFLILLLIYRFVIPGIDEPDWLLRATKILSSIDNYSHFLNKPFNIFPDLSETKKISLETHKNCKDYLEKVNPLSLWYSINYSNCLDSFKIIAIKYSITLFFFLPFSILFFLRNFIYKKNKTKKKEKLLYENNIELISLCLLFPSVIYTSNYTSYETLCLFLAFLFFITKTNEYISILLLTLIFWIDIGFFTIMVFFYIFINFFLYFFEKKKVVTAIVILMLVLLVIVIGKSFIAKVLEYVPFFGATASSINEYSVLLYTDKYFILVRPLILFTSLFFMTAYKIKTIFLYFIILFVFYDFFSKLMKKNYQNNFLLKKDFLYFVGSIFFITSISIVFPVLSFSKYYVFIFPFFLKIFLHFYTCKNIRYFLITCNFVVIIHFLIYYIF